MYYESRLPFCIMDIQSKIGARIHELRVSQSLTQEAVAYKADLDRSFMNHVENGKRNISVGALEKIICSGLEMTFQDFFSHDFFKAKGRLKK